MGCGDAFPVFPLIQIIQRKAVHCHAFQIFVGLYETPVHTDDRVFEVIWIQILYPGGPSVGEKRLFSHKLARHFFQKNRHHMDVKIGKTAFGKLGKNLKRRVSVCAPLIPDEEREAMEMEGQRLCKIKKKLHLNKY